MKEKQIKDLIRKKVRKLILENLEVDSAYTSLVKGVHYSLIELKKITGFDESHIKTLCDDHVLYHDKYDDTYSLNE